MDPRLQRRVQRYGWDRAAAIYERGWSAQLEPAQSLLLERAELAPGEVVLDVACGTGLVTRRAALAVRPAGRALGVDISDEMVELAAGLAAAEGLQDLRFRRMDAEQLEFPGDGFDVVLSALGLMYVPDFPRALREQLRVLRPGGRALAAVWGDRQSCGWAEIFSIVDRRVRSEVCPLFFQLGTRDALANALRAAGFEEVVSTRIRSTLAYATAADALEAAFDAGPVALACSRFDAATRASAEAEYLESIEPFRAGDGYHVPGEFVVAEGRKPR